jgi:hypothetical protein
MKDAEKGTATSGAGRGFQALLPLQAKRCASL